MNRGSVAMTATVEGTLRQHLVRSDGQEDVCFATYCVSSGMERTTALLREVILPEPGERAVHGNASFTGAYVLRAVGIAAERGEGLALLHSHPGSRGWQGLSLPDADAEGSYVALVTQYTGLPLVGLTLAGRDGAWSARFWTELAGPAWCESVRVIDDMYRVTWNDELRPPPVEQASQVRTISAWGSKTQANLARLRVLVVGVGSVGLDIALRVAASGFQTVGVMDPDIVTELNRDRMIGVTREDVRLRRLKVDVAHRLMTEQATASDFVGVKHPASVCRVASLAEALDYDLIISCVDRPWPRAVLNAVAYADLIPVVDGGIAIDVFDDGDGMRSATWRAHVLRPGRPCMVCNGQLDPALVPVDREGLLDDPEYLKRAGIQEPARQNVALLCAGPISSILALLVSFLVAPGGQGEPGPLRYSLAAHDLDHVPCSSSSHCVLEQQVAVGDGRLPFAGE